MKKIIQPYYVLIWNFNKKDVEYYDIMPYLIDVYKKENKRKYKIFCRGFDSTNDYKQFILNASRNRFWAKCEYEIIVSRWPYDEKDPLKYSKKIDAYEQIKNNIDVITNHFINQL